MPATQDAATLSDIDVYGNAQAAEQASEDVAI